MYTPQQLLEDSDQDDMMMEDDEDGSVFESKGSFYSADLEDMQSGTKSYKMHHLNRHAQTDYCSSSY